MTGEDPSQSRHIVSFMLGATLVGTICRKRGLHGHAVPVRAKLLICGDSWFIHNALGGRSSPPPIFGNFENQFPNFLRGHSFTKVTPPSEAEETSAAYLENTPRL